MELIKTDDSGHGGPWPAGRPWQILSGTGLKIAGIILMTMDHLHQMFIAQGAPAWLNWFGRPVATIFMFLCAEGFFYTRNRGRYMLQLLVGFLFMAAMNQILSTLMPVEEIILFNNIFGTLLMAAFYMWMLDRFRDGVREKKPAKVLSAIGGFFLPFVIGIVMALAVQHEYRILAMILLFIPNPISVEGGFVLVLMGALFYALHRHRIIQITLILAVSSLVWFFAQNDPTNFQWLMVFAIIPVLLYNGRRGRGGKYFFYIFYPSHIYLLYCIAWLLRGPV
jgi:hypothetical protein